MAKVRVPQENDEISISRNGDVHDPTVYPVTDHTVEVPDEDVAHFLAVVAGAELADTPAAKPKPDTKNEKADSTST